MAMTTPSADRPIALVTGANRGIGFEIARQLGRQRITVLLGARDAVRGHQAAAALRAEHIDARPILLDVTRQDTIDAAAVAVRYATLDADGPSGGFFNEAGPVAW
jgi:NAD(P)-dependent dehydrogenase (short-subunit alcohol dehydrogenase family)